MFWPNQCPCLEQLLTTPYQNHVAPLMFFTPSILQVVDDLAFVGSSQTSNISIFVLSEVRLEPIRTINLCMAAGGDSRTHSLAIHVNSKSEEVHVVAVMAEVQAHQSIFGNGVDRIKGTKLCCWDATQEFKNRAEVFKKKPEPEIDETAKSTKKILTMIASVERKLSNQMEKIMESMKACEQRLTNIESSLRNADVQQQFHET